jgi:hypothetical protein
VAQRDSEAGVWLAESEDVPGLVAEASSPSILAQKLRSLIPELLELNGVRPVRARGFTYDTSTKRAKLWPPDGQLHAQGEGDSSRERMLF